MEKEYSWKHAHVAGFVELRVDGMPLVRVYDLEMLEQALKDRKEFYEINRNDVNKMFVERYEEGLSLLGETTNE